MTDENREGIVARRDLMIATSGIGALVAEITRSGIVFAQSAQAPASPSPGGIVVERRGAVLLIGLDLAAAKDRLTPTALIAMGKALYQLEQDDGLRVAVLHSLGTNFCVGVDLPGFTAAQAAGVLPPKDPEYLHPLGLRPPIRTKPVIVAVQGRAYGVGDELVLAADIRVAAQDAIFGQLEVTHGIFPAGGATVRLTREAGWGNAMLHMLTGEDWNADEAYRLGLVQAVTVPGKQLDRAIEIANKVAAASPLGVRATLASAHQAISDEDAALQALGPAFSKILQTDDAKESVRAAQENRAPAFQGR